MIMDTVVMLEEVHGQTHVLFDDLQVKIASMGMDDFLDVLCLGHGGTVKGNQKAMSLLLNIRQKIPILVCRKKQFILYPVTTSMGKKVWIRYVSTGKMKKIHEHQTRITIHGNIRFDVHANIRAIKRQHHRCSSYLAKLDMFERKCSVVALTDIKLLLE